MLAEYKLSAIEVLIFEIFTDSYISHDQFISVNNVLEEYDDMKEASKKSKENE